jgi:hypothetical protein
MYLQFHIAITMSQYSWKKSNLINGVDVIAFPVFDNIEQYVSVVMHCQNESYIHLNYVNPPHPNPQRAFCFIEKNIQDFSNMSKNTTDFYGCM